MGCVYITNSHKFIRQIYRKMLKHLKIYIFISTKFVSKIHCCKIQEFHLRNVSVYASCIYNMFLWCSCVYFSFSFLSSNHFFFGVIYSSMFKHADEDEWIELTCI